MQENLANPLGPSFQILLLLVILVPAILFLVTQQNTLKLIHPLNRTMRPGQIWLQMIPVFNLYYQFVVVAGISDSLQREFNSYFNDSDSILPDATVTEATAGRRPTYSVGLAYCWLFVGSTVLNWFGTSVSIVTGLAGLAAMVCWIVYWVKLAGFKKKLKTMSPA